MLCDGSSCSHPFRAAKNLRGLQVYEPYEFAKKCILDNVTIKPTTEKVSVHVTCSAHEMKLTGTAKEVMKRLAPNNVFPQHVYCCGRAGDRGFNYPELNKASLKYLKKGVDGCTKRYSNNQTCEVGLSFHSGIPYRSVLHLIDETCSANQEFVSWSCWGLVFALAGGLPAAYPQSCLATAHSAATTQSVIPCSRLSRQGPIVSFFTHGICQPGLQHLG